MDKRIIAMFAVVLVVGLLGLFYPKSTNTVQQVVGAAPTGATFGDAKVAMVKVSFLTSTSTSLLNTDANTRYTKNLEMACNNVGSSPSSSNVANWNISASTSTTPASAAYVNANPNFVFTNVYLATSSPWLLFASSTIQNGNGGFASTTEWLPGTYLDIFVNATNTAQCTVGVSYLSS